MKTAAGLLSIVLFLTTGIAVAGAKGVYDPKGGEKLKNVVELCATDDKEKFGKAWGSYIAENDLEGEELQKAIKDVSDRAKAHRKHELKLEESEEWLAERREFMSEVARRALHPAR